MGMDEASSPKVEAFRQRGEIHFSSLNMEDSYARKS